MVDSKTETLEAKRIAEKNPVVATATIAEQLTPMDQHVTEQRCMKDIGWRRGRVDLSKIAAH